MSMCDPNAGALINELRARGSFPKLNSASDADAIRDRRLLTASTGHITLGCALSSTDCAIPAFAVLAPRIVRVILLKVGVDWDTSWHKMELIHAGLPQLWSYVTSAKRIMPQNATRTQSNAARSSLDPSIQAWYKSRRCGSCTAAC